MQHVLGVLSDHAEQLGVGSVAGLVAVGSVLIVLGTQAVALRFWTRSRTNANLLLDDWLTIPAWMTFVAATSLIFYCISLGSLGYAHKDRTPEDIKRTLKPSVEAQISMNAISIVCFGSVKASALLFYRRVFCADGKHPTLNKIIVGAVPFVGLWTVVFVLLTIFQCGTHFSAPYDGTVLKYCTMSYPSIRGMAVSDVLLDLFVISLPLYPIAKLSTTQKNKMAIAGVFLVALVQVAALLRLKKTYSDNFFSGLAASITRFIIIEKVTSLGRENVHKDIEYYTSKICFYWILEMGVSVVVVNLPPIWTALHSSARPLGPYTDIEDDE